MDSLVSKVVDVQGCKGSSVLSRYGNEIRYLYVLDVRYLMLLESAMLFKPLWLYDVGCQVCDARCCLWHVQRHSRSMVPCMT